MESSGDVVLAALWWAWSVFAWLTSALDVDEGGIRLVMLGAMGAMFGAALAVPGASETTLLAANRTVAAGDALLSPTVTKRVIKQFTRLPRPTPPKEFDELTTREQEVFRLIAKGLSNPEIAEELYISDTTVKTHITHILQELNLRDRVQAVVLAHQTGLLAERGYVASARADAQGSSPETSTSS